MSLNCCDQPCDNRRLPWLITALMPERLLRRWRARTNNRRRRSLARDVTTLNDHLLRDIGLDRIDVRERR